MEQISTICAISTPPGRGGIAVARVSGPRAIYIADSIWRGKPLAKAQSHTAHLGTVTAADGTPLDTAVATIYRSPASFTGENVVEISVHGSTYIQQQLLHTLVQAGCTMAEPGEFTRRAFTNGRLDLAEAEAVADMIAASSKAAHRLAISQLKGRFSSHINRLREQLIEIASLLELELDFSEEDVTFADRKQLYDLANDILTTVNSLAATFSSGQAIRDGIPVAIVGQPNTGKSSLLNALLHSDRAIVSDIPGTTRDTVEDTLDINGHTIRLIDTAGIRHTDDPIETLGIQRALNRVADAHITILLTTPQELAQGHTHSLAARIRRHLPPQATLIIAINKADTIPAHTIPDIIAQAPESDYITAISAKTGYNIDTLTQHIVDMATAGLPDDESLIVT
ncbi:MAG: tRNA uridine-5-carboxymethylaminomethyl(34) synthesis GTPase MnmE, partial [Muribaculaceae bacterium]|nr:tRNA uridine-5-carboxymethylaminomethyl(34) synthesis GTPase MnmE [Muribaculaceae bacterium]